MCACLDPITPEEKGNGSCGPCSISSNPSAATSSCCLSDRPRYHSANSSVCSTFQTIHLHSINGIILWTAALPAKVSEHHVRRAGVVAGGQAAAGPEFERGGVPEF